MTEPNYIGLYADQIAATQRLQSAQRRARANLEQALIAAIDGRADIAAEKIEIALAALATNP